MSIKCCNGCVPPKRNAYCHSYCPEYIEEKAKHEADKAAMDKEKAVQGRLTEQARKAVNRANKKKRKD